MTELRVRDLLISEISNRRQASVTLQNESASLIDLRTNQQVRVKVVTCCSWVSDV